MIRARQYAIALVDKLDETLLLIAFFEIFECFFFSFLRIKPFNPHSFRFSNTIKYYFIEGAGRAKKEKEGKKGPHPRQSLG